MIFYTKIGDKVKKGEVIAELFTDKKSKIDDVKKRITNALTFSKNTVAKPRLIKKIIT
jgi:thymidine phosphorylase